MGEITTVGGLLLVTTAVALSSAAFINGHVTPRTVLHRFSSTTSFLTRTELWLNQTLDHFSPFNRDKFQQRYYEFLDYFRIPDGPIFLKICGEGPCNGISNDYLSPPIFVNMYMRKEVVVDLDFWSVFVHVFDKDDNPIQISTLVLAKKFGAAIVSLEHRYYGKSSPFKSLTTDNLRYLSSKQALFDLAVFRQHYQESLNLKLNKKAQNPWFVFGISYPGALSAWFRLKFPHLTCGSLASSAVVLAVYNFTEFDRQIGESAGPECKAALQETNRLVEQKFAANKKDVKALFGAAELEIDGDFFYFLADAAVIAFQYGNPDTLCSPLVKARKAGNDLVDAFAKYVKDYYIGTFGTNVQTYNQNHLKNTALGEDSADRLWWFQVCTEVAYFQIAPAKDIMRSSKVDAKYHLDLCKNVFGEGIYPDVATTNIYYGGTKSKGSKIFFTNGSQDPWRHASNQISSPKMPSYLITCHNCGHGTDLRGCPQAQLNTEGDAQNCSSPNEVHKVRHQLVEKMDLWLSECQPRPTTGDELWNLENPSPHVNFFQ